jgi:hypothetical protein
MYNSISKDQEKYFWNSPDNYVSLSRYSENKGIRYHGISDEFLTNNILPNIVGKITLPENKSTVVKENRSKSSKTLEKYTSHPIKPIARFNESPKKVNNVGSSLSVSENLNFNKQLLEDNMFTGKGFGFKINSTILGNSLNKRRNQMQQNNNHNEVNNIQRSKEYNISKSTVKRTKKDKNVGIQIHQDEHNPNQYDCILFLLSYL